MHINPYLGFGLWILVLSREYNLTMYDSYDDLSHIIWLILGDLLFLRRDVYAVLKSTTS